MCVEKRIEERKLVLSFLFLLHLSLATALAGMKSSIARKRAKNILFGVEISGRNVYT